MAYLNKDETIKALEIGLEKSINGEYEETFRSLYEARLMYHELPCITRNYFLQKSRDEAAAKAFEIAEKYALNGKYKEALECAKEARLINPELPDIKRVVKLLEVLSADPNITHYGILGVEENANENEIRLAYRKLAVDLNPDVNHFPKASEAFRRIYEAMSALSNDRPKYDNDLAVAREARAIAKSEGIRQARALALAHLEAKFDKDAVVAPKYRARYGFDVSETSDRMISFIEPQAASQKEKAAFEALHLVDCEAHARSFAKFEAMFGKDVSVTLGSRASFDVLDTFDGTISASELQAAFEAYDKEPESTTHHPSEERFVCSSDEVAGRGTKRSNTTQATLTNPVLKKKMDGQGPRLFR